MSDRAPTGGGGTRPEHPAGVSRLLFVHAHPDDETLATGVALAHHAAAGDRVHVLTATLGEEGEVIPAELAHLEGTPALARHRRGELHRAMEVLGVDHEFLGGDEPRWRDSGMAGMPSAEHPRAFMNADVAEAAALVAARIRHLAPDVVVTYDASGGYGHPDHVQTHRVSVAAVRSLPPQERPALYAVLLPAGWARQDRAWLREHVDPALGLKLLTDQDPYPPSVVDDALVTHELVDPAARELQVRALREHRTQVTVHDGYYALSNDIAARLAGREGYARIDPGTGELAAGATGGRQAGTRHTGLVSRGEGRA